MRFISTNVEGCAKCSSRQGVCGNCLAPPITTKVFCAECGSAFGRKNWTTSRGKRKVWQCNNRYKVKGQIGCQNNHIDEGTLEKAVMMAVKLLSENMDLLHGKWNKILEENQLL